MMNRSSFSSLMSKGDKNMYGNKKKPKPKGSMVPPKPRGGMVPPKPKPKPKSKGIIS